MSAQSPSGMDAAEVPSTQLGLPRPLLHPDGGNP